MAKVYSPVRNYTGKVAGVGFVDGVGETEDEGAISYFRRHGYQVGGAAPAVSMTDPAQESKVFDLASASIPEMRAYAKEQGITIPSDAKKGDEIRAVITEAQKVPETSGTPETPQD